MSSSNSQENTIYRSLSGQIQMGFFDNGVRFPSANVVAARYKVSYCPAVRALKSLEKDGLIQLCRGKETVVLRKPYKNFLESGVYRERAAAIADLSGALALISPDIFYQGLFRMDEEELIVPGVDGSASIKQLYQLFERLLKALGSQTALSLYYDVGSFTESAYLDMIHILHKDDYDQWIKGLTIMLMQGIKACRSQNYPEAKSVLTDYFSYVFGEFESYPYKAKALDSKPFIWEPRKGRTRYCDSIAIDLVCKIHQGVHPAGSMLPSGLVLADTYHVSTITIRRSIELLNKIGLVKNINGVGTIVVGCESHEIHEKLKELMLEEDLRAFLEGIQFLAITCESVISCSFPYFTKDTLGEIANAISIKEQMASVVTTISTCLLAVVRRCPLAAVGEIYSKLTLLLVKGSVLRLDSYGKEKIPHWENLSGLLLESIAANDAAGFASSFRRLIEGNFAMVKNYLVKAGISGADQVVNPVGQ